MQGGNDFRSYGDRGLYGNRNYFDRFNGLNGILDDDDYYGRNYRYGNIHGYNFNNGLGRYGNRLHGFDFNRYDPRYRIRNYMHRLSDYGRGLGNYALQRYGYHGLPHSLRRHGYNLRDYGLGPSGYGHEGYGNVYKGRLVYRNFRPDSYLYGRHGRRGIYGGHHVHPHFGYGAYK